MEIVKELDLRGKISALTNTDAYKRSGSGTDVFEGGRRYQESQNIVERVYSRARRKMLSEYPEPNRELKAVDRARRASSRSDDKDNSILDLIQ